MLADALGRPLKLIITAGQVGDITQAPALLKIQNGDAVLADKAYAAMLCARASLVSAPKR